MVEMISRKRDGRNQYDFSCVKCGAACEIGAPRDYKALIECPEKCGALYIQIRQRGFYGRHVLTPVRGQQVSK